MGMQARLNAIARTPQFQQALDAEMERRNLDASEVMQCYRQIYGYLSKWAHGHDNFIFIEDRFYKDNERAGLVALFKVQDQWGNPLAWKEVRELTVRAREREGWDGENSEGGKGLGKQGVGAKGPGGDEVGRNEAGENGAGGNGPGGKDGGI